MGADADREWEAHGHMERYDGQRAQQMKEHRDQGVGTLVQTMRAQRCVIRGMSLTGLVPPAENVGGTKPQGWSDTHAS